MCGMAQERAPTGGDLETDERGVQMRRGNHAVNNGAIIERNANGLGEPQVWSKGLTICS